MYKRIIVLFLPCILLFISINSLTVNILTVRAQTAPTITAFSSDLQSITPDQAESGQQYANLTWQVDGLTAGQAVYLQVFVAGAWHDVKPEALPASGSLKWAVAHTLDFAPPKFRLVARNSSGNEAAARELTIPYANPVDKDHPTIIRWFSVQNASLSAEVVSPISWEVRNRPPNANLRFLQVKRDGSVVSVELSRSNTWIRSTGQGYIRPVADDETFDFKMEVFNIQSGEVYAQTSLSIPANLPALQPSATSAPALIASMTPVSSADDVILYFKTDQVGYRRGETIKLTWQTRNADAVLIDAYDIDLSVTHPGKLYHHLDNLPASGSVEVVIPADYQGSGYKFFLTAKKTGAPIASKFTEVLFTDAVYQPTILKLNEFEISPLPLKRGANVTIRWNVTVSIRGITPAGTIDFVPTHEFDNKLLFEIFPTYASGNSPGSVHTTHFTHQPFVGSLNWTIPNVEAAYSQLFINIGYERNGVQFIGENKAYPLTEDHDRSETVQAAFQQFETGFMVWNGRTGEVRVFFGGASGSVENFVQEEYATLPDPSSTLVPPQGKIRPANAFGRVWGNLADYRDRLGWAVSPEQGYTMTIQYPAGQNTIIISLPDGRNVTYVNGAFATYTIQ